MFWDIIRFFKELFCFHQWEYIKGTGRYRVKCKKCDKSDWSCRY